MYSLQCTLECMSFTFLYASSFLLLMIIIQLYVNLTLTSCVLPFFFIFLLLHDVFTQKSNDTCPPTCRSPFYCQNTTESQLTRRTPPSYEDGVYMMAGSDRPSPRYLSQVVMKGEDGLGSSRNLTTIFAFFGKVFLDIKQKVSFLCSCKGCHCNLTIFMLDQ